MTKNPEEFKMPFWDHVIELRRRLIYSLIAITIGFSVAYQFSDFIFLWLSAPFAKAYQDVFGREPTMITTSLVESFMVYLKVGLLGGFFFACPFVFYQLWKFISPALRPRERKHVIPFVLLATLFFFGGAMFGYCVVYPVGFRYFLSITPGGFIVPMIRMQEYFEMAAWMMIVFGLVFEAPLLVLYLVGLGLIRQSHLTNSWRGIIVGIAIASAVLTPADPGSMLLMMVPLLGLYLLTIVLSFFVKKKMSGDGL